jgi:methylated-DNA-[protein]-cysteine S-methyltransferase
MPKPWTFSADVVAAADLPTPLGPMTALATARGLCALWFDARERAGAALPPHNDPEHPTLRATAHWLEAYWAGQDAGVPLPPLDLQGTAFQTAVWQALLQIPRGHTRTYGEVAQAVQAATGRNAVPRATGTACGANPVGLIVPCHRVVGRDGSLTGFAAGLPRKQALLVHEGARLA